jgi:hypothetical protein
MSFKDKILNIVNAYRKLATLGIGLAITFVVGTSIGMVDHNNIAMATGGSHSSGGTHFSG